MHKNIYILLVLCCHFIGNAQITYYQDIYKGGICITGTSSSDGAGTLNVPYYVEPGSVIKKIFLITYEIIGVNESSDNFDLFIDGITFNQNQIDNDLVFSPNNLNSNIYLGHTTHITEITDKIILMPFSIIINMPPQFGKPGCPACVYGSPMVAILYENPSLPLINVNLEINNGQNNNTANLHFENFNPPIYTENIAMGGHTDRLGANLSDGYNYSLNGFSIGQNNQDDIISFGGGTVGTFYYQNGILTGLTDDVANNSLSDSDGILLINNYVGSSLNPMDIEYSYIQPTNFLHNVLVGLYFAYSTPCDTFSVSISNDTAVCKGTQLQLNASTSNPTATYEWLASTGSVANPTPGLSCNTCPNPIFTADSSMFYTVRIWNNDSCSVVRPLKINVRPRPKFGNITTMASECGTSTGSISTSSITALSELFAVDDNGTVFSSISQNQSSATIGNLSAGNYTVYFIDTNGCQSADSIVFVDEVNSTVANFTVDPMSGAAPLVVNVDNTSQNASNFEWWLNTTSTGNTPTSYFDTSGAYIITLVAWQNDLSCADTMYKTIFVYDSLLVQIPNVFTPNGDGINDFFSLTSNMPLNCDLVILNRWGNVVFEYKGKINVGTTNLWDASTSSATLGSNTTATVLEGVYFYKLRFETSEETPFGVQTFLPSNKDGFVHVER